MDSKPQSQPCSNFTSVVYVDGSIGVLKGETVSANNTADYGGTTVKCTHYVFEVAGRSFCRKLLW